MVIFDSFIFLQFGIKIAGMGLNPVSDHLATEIPFTKKHNIIDFKSLISLRKEFVGSFPLI